MVEEDFHTDVVLKGHHCIGAMVKPTYTRIKIKATWDLH